MVPAIVSSVGTFFPTRDRKGAVIFALALKPGFGKLRSMEMIGRFLFWDFPRGSWQYDIICVLILAFIFATPREIFRDQPKAASVIMLPPEQNTGLFWIDPQKLAGVPAADLVPQATMLVNARSKTHKTITRVEPILDAEQDVTGYVAYTRP
jgi:hypothetical protein